MMAVAAAVASTPAPMRAAPMGGHVAPRGGIRRGITRVRDQWTTHPCRAVTGTAVHDATWPG